MRNDNVQRRIQGMQSRLAGLNARLNAVAEKNESQEQRIAQLQQQMDELEQQAIAAVKTHDPTEDKIFEAQFQIRTKNLLELSFRLQETEKINRQNAAQLCRQEQEIKKQQSILHHQTVELGLSRQKYREEIKNLYNTGKQTYHFFKKTTEEHENLWLKGRLLEVWGETDGSVNCLCELSRYRLVTANDQRILKIWDIRTGCCIKEIEVENSVCKIIELIDRRILTADLLGRLSIWDSYTGKRERVWESGADTVTCLLQIRMNNFNHIISGNDQGMLKIWDLTGHCLRTWKAHVGEVTFLFEAERGVISGGRFDLKFWDNQGSLLYTWCDKVRNRVNISNHLQTYTASLQLHKNFLYFSLINEKIIFKLLDADEKLHSGEITKADLNIGLFSRILSYIQCSEFKYITEMDEQDLFKIVEQKLAPMDHTFDIVNTAICLCNGSIVTSNTHALLGTHTLKRWDGNTEKCSIWEENTTSKVLYLASLDNGFVVAGYHCGKIAIWDPQTQVCITTWSIQSSSVSGMIILRDGRIVSSDDQGINVWAGPAYQLGSHLTASSFER